MTPTTLHRLVLFSRLCALAAGFFALVALSGYLFASPGLVALHTGLKAMSPLTAAGLLALAVAAMSESLHSLRPATVGAALAGAIGATALISHALAGADVLSPWLGAHLNPPASVPIGRTSIGTAIGLVLIAMALVLHRRVPSVADIGAGIALLVAGAALLGYLYGVGDLYALPMFNTMALHTAGALFLLALAVLTVEPRLGLVAVIGSDDIGGATTRRQLGFALLPIVGGWLLLRETEAHHLGPAIAMALLVLVTVVPLVLLVLRDGEALNALDRARQERARAQEVMGNEMVDRLARQSQELKREAQERANAEDVMFRAQRMEAIGQLTGGIAHEFNNLLMAIRGSLELIEEKLPADVAGADNGRVARQIANAMAAADKGTRVTAQLLAFSRSQRLNLRAAEVDPVLSSARTLIGTSLGPDIQLDLRLDAAGVWAVIDPDQLELAILNLAMNARDAMRDGGLVTIESHFARDVLGEEARARDCVVVRVTDDGIGMLPDVAEKAVEPFFTTKGVGQGSGLGLAQVYGFVRQCGGDLRIASAPGHGTTVELVFACTDPPEKAAPPVVGARSTAPPAADGRQILVIDDDAIVRAVIVDALESDGFTVLQAEDGPSGLALLETSQPAAVVIDFLMPGMNGAEVARQVQANRPGLPIIFVSGYFDTLALDGISGAIVLRKPFDLQLLNNALARILA